MKSVILAVAVIVLTTSTGSARIWYIRPDGTGDAPTIGAGVDSAGVSDTVVVACGTYYESGISLNKYDLTLMSETGMSDCVTIDAQQLDRVFDVDIHIDSTCVVKGFTITGGDCNRGGGIFIYEYASPVFINLSIEGNQGHYGGGMGIARGASPRLENVAFTRNHAEYKGGGLYLEECSPVLYDCLFLENEGAAMWIEMEASPAVTNTDFISNDQAAVVSWATCDFQGCLFEGNRSGAIEIENSAPQISDCVFCGNTGLEGAAIGIFGGDPVIENTVIWANSGTTGAIFIENGSAIIRNCTIAGNDGIIGSALSVISEDHTHGPILIERSIIAHGTGRSGAVYCWPSSEPDMELRCCNIFGNEGGDWVGCIESQYGVDGNFSACPSFCNLAIGNLLVCDGSPCLPGNHPSGYDCGLVGALGEGCTCGPTSSGPTTWGRIKAGFGE
jgi:hypothetical protein